jgi:hypothetical protein
MAPAADKVPVVCPSCNKRLLVPAGTLGKQGRCPACQTVFTLEQMWEAEAVAPAPSTFPSLTPLAPAPAAYAPPPANAWGATAQPAANPWGSPAPAAKSTYDDDDFKGDYNLQAAPPVVANPYASPTYTPVSTGSSYQRPKQKGEFWSSSVMGGLLLMVIAVVWFFGGLALNRIFFYPTIMFIIGFVTFFKGLFSGNVAGE